MESIVERILQNGRMFNKEEKNFILKNSDLVIKIYILSMIDTYKTLKDV